MDSKWGKSPKSTEYEKMNDHQFFGLQSFFFFSPKKVKKNKVSVHPRLSA